MSALKCALLERKPQMKYIYCLNKTDTTKSDAWMSALKCAFLERKPQMKYIHCLNKTDSTKSDA